MNDLEDARADFTRCRHCEKTTEKLVKANEHAGHLNERLEAVVNEVETLEVKVKYLEDALNAPSGERWETYANRLEQIEYRLESEVDAADFENLSQKDEIQRLKCRLELFSGASYESAVEAIHALHNSGERELCICPYCSDHRRLR